jgi:hypothetical protein
MRAVARRIGRRAKAGGPGICKWVSLSRDARKARRGTPVKSAPSTPERPYYGLWQEAGRSAALPVHWPLDPAPLPPLVGGDGFANAGAAAVAKAALAKRTAPSLRALVMFTSLPGGCLHMPSGHPNRMYEIPHFGRKSCGKGGLWDLIPLRLAREGRRSPSASRRDRPCRPPSRGSSRKGCSASWPTTRVLHLPIYFVN